MSFLKITGIVDSNHRLMADVPVTIVPGRIELYLSVPGDGDDVSEMEWMTGISREWSAELSDPREDIYTLEDGAPIDAAR